MAKRSSPRRGSLGFLPKKRARRVYPSVSSWPETSETKPLMFAGYKAGMTQIIGIDKQKTSHSFQQEVALPVTIIECPPLKVIGFKAYEKTPYGLKAIPKEQISTKKDSIEEIRLIVRTNPPHKKKPEEFEVKVGGPADKALEYAESQNGKEIPVSDVLKPGEYVDVVAVTKGKGIQGVVKRWGAKIQTRKAKGKRRHAGVINPWTPSRTMWTSLQAGQTGYHRRTLLNSRVIKIGDNNEEITIKGGIPHYGVVRSNYVLLKGSVPGAKKRLIMIRPSIRPQTEKELPEIKEVVK
ncbi:MAG: 50S ribosomal protein L3 [Candidatus Diapherotrites archaeon]|nr:50S ribosomal protein L3 [Candidatus Diapherotrites archaeon]